MNPKSAEPIFCVELTIGMGTAQVVIRNGLSSSNLFFVGFFELYILRVFRE